MTQRLSGRARQRRNRAILSASDVCHICGHPGSDAIDHVEPLARAVDDADFKRRDTDLINLRPAHHDIPCPTCDIKCNRVKADKLFAPVLRRSGSLRHRG